MFVYINAFTYKFAQKKRKKKEKEKGMKNN
jgi:hypothetical protein